MTRASRIPSFTSEEASDAVLEAGAILHRLGQSACTKEDLQRAFPRLSSRELERLLRKLVRSGLVRKEGEVYAVASSFFYAYPQGTQMDFLGKLFIPVVVSLAMDAAEGLLLPVYLRISPEEQERLFDDKVTKLFEQMSALADQADDQSQDRMLFVAGTSRFSPELEGFEQAMEILRQAGKDRADPVWRPRAILSYFRAPMGSVGAANQLIMQFEETFEPVKARQIEANYVLLLGFGVAPQGDVA